MSIFAKSLKTFTTDILGEPVELKINNAVWVLLKAKFKLTQAEYQEKALEENNIYAGKFIAAVLMANGYKVTEDDVNNNIDEIDVVKFVRDYNAVLVEKSREVFGKDEEEEEGK